METVITIAVVLLIILTARFWVPVLIGLIGLALFVLGASVVGGMFVAAFLWPYVSFEAQVAMAAIIDLLALILGAIMMLYASNTITRWVQGV